VPALTAIVAGRPAAGLSAAELEALALPETRARKVGARDAAAAVAFGHWGATTVSAACAIADAVGIAVFATGGIGGVHREAEHTFDISQDLAAIAGCRVAVVTAGAKAILDLPKTLEALEALGVPVVGLSTSELPAFYSKKSGLTLEHRVDGALEAARLLQARFDLLGEGGVVLANPIPEAAAADPTRIELAVAAALRAAHEQRIAGKALTPFLLAEVARETGGESLQANLALLEHNARTAGEIAVALAGLRRLPR
jgi:pseudouridine-5'-phosphate glycosidase